MEITRRGFLQAICSVGVVCATPIKYFSPALHARIVASITLTELIQQVIYNRVHEIAQNVALTSPLLDYLKNNQNLAAIEQEKRKAAARIAWVSLKQKAALQSMDDRIRADQIALNRSRFFQKMADLDTHSVEEAKAILAGA
jgi:hypothetical protein